MLTFVLLSSLASTEVDMFYNKTKLIYERKKWPNIEKNYKTEEKINLVYLERKAEK